MRNKISINIILLRAGLLLFFLVTLLINLAISPLDSYGAFLPKSTSQLQLIQDSLNPDSTISDTIVVPPAKSSALKSKVEYSAEDSIRFDITKQKAYLFGNAKVDYETVTLTAEYIELDMSSNIVYAIGKPDSTGKLKGKPIFSDDGQEFSTETITYNFETEKGLITQVITTEGEGFIHSDTAKKFPDDILYIKNGAYTTCDLEHPHFSIKSPRIKIIPDDKIITGPAYLTIADIPTPLVLPFGLFPNKRGRSSGILIPTYGESLNTGFFLKDGGYYFGINDRVDLALRGDIYSKGSWALKAHSNYKKRYKYSGYLDISYSEYQFGERELAEFSKQEDFFIAWSHRQDRKARPNSTFSAKVNAGSKNYNKFNSNNADTYLTNTFQSNISYSKSWANRPYNLSLNLRHSQNTLTNVVDISLPEVAFSVNRVYPFKQKNKTSKGNAFSNIGVSYRLDAINKISTYDSLLFKETEFSDFNNGIKHTVPISTSIKLLKYINLNPSINFTDRWYFQSIEKQWIDDTLFTTTDTIVGYIKTDTIIGFQNAYDFSFSASLTTKLFGMIQFRSKHLKAIRHVLTPNIGFSYRPDFGDNQWGYYKSVQSDTLGNTTDYSKFGDNTTWRGYYGAPPIGKSGVVNFSLSNNLEMKVRSKKDTANPTRKIMLIENLKVSASYNMAVDSMNWSKISLTGFTRLIGNQLFVRYAAFFDPYILIVNANGVTTRVNRFEINEYGRLARPENSDWFVGLNLRLGPDMFKRSNKPPTLTEKTSDKGSEEELEMINNNPESFIDFSTPWSVNLAYNLSYLNRYYYTSSESRDSISSKLIQTLSITADINITDKWRIGVRTGYDFVNEDFTYTSIDIYRDLHCWEMNFNWIPFGFRQSYNFGIKVKSSILQDLKLTRKREWYDRSQQF